MAEPLEARMYRSAVDDKVTFAVSVEHVFLDLVARETAHLIAKAIAEKFVEEHYSEIAAKLSQDAIANLAIAEASKKIAEEIQLRPNIIHEVEHHTAVYQRGLLGGLRRIR